jgi:transposase
MSTKIHLRAEGQGKPITFLLTPGERHEITQAQPLMQQGAIRRPSGQKRLYPKRLAGDKGYSFRPFRQFLHQKGVCNTIPTRSNQPRNPSFDKEIYRQRNKVERLINRLKQFRRIATRYEKRAVNYAAMLTIAMILLWL